MMGPTVSDVLMAMALGAATGQLRLPPPTAAEEVPPTVSCNSVLTLDHTNFTDVVSKHDFIVVEFYATWCSYCKALAPEYEKAANILSKHDPPVILARIDANEESNGRLASEFCITGFPTIKILRNGGKTNQDYEGDHDANSIVNFLKRQLGPSSIEINTAEAATLTFFDLKRIYVVGVFNDFSGEYFENYMTVAEKMRSSDYEFVHTNEEKFVPLFGEPVTKPSLRVVKPFDEPFMDSKDFNVDALEKFIQESTVPLVTVLDMASSNIAYLKKFFETSSDGAILFLNFNKELDAFQAKYNDVARLHKGKGTRFLMGDIEANRIVFPYFLLTEEQAPLLTIETADGEKYLNERIEPDQLAPWINDYMGGLVKPFAKSEPIPEANDEPCKVVVRDTLDDFVLKSEKNVLLEFYAPWCKYCKNLAPILEEVAVSFKDDPDVVIAKFDATVNEVPPGTFEVIGFPTVYFRSSTGHLVRYCGDRTKEDIITFIEENRDGKAVKL